MRKSSVVGISVATIVSLSAGQALAQDAWSVAQRCAMLNSDPQFRPLLNAQVRENPIITPTVSGGFAMINSSTRGATGTGWGSGNSIGLGGNAHLEAELGALHPFWLRASAQFIAAGRMGFLGEVAAGFTLRNYGVYFVPAGASVSYGRYYVSVQTWNNHCSLRRFDFHGFAGVRWAGFFARTDGTNTYDGIGWIAPQLGLSVRWRFPNGRSTEATLAGMIDVTHLSGGGYGRFTASYGWFYAGMDAGFFLPFDRMSGPSFSAWWFTGNIGVHFEI